MLVTNNSHVVEIFTCMDRWNIELYFFIEELCDYFYDIITIMLISFGIRSCICMQGLYYPLLEKIYSYMWEMIACLVRLHWEISFGKKEGLHA